MNQNLNPQQQQAVMAGTGPILVLAGPGSGKTRVLTQRVAYLTHSLGVRPYHILAVTFTNKAAREMEDRLVNLIGEKARGLTLGTFHANCARLLRREAEYLPFGSNFVIFDEDDQLGLVKQCIADLNLDEKRYRPTSMLNAISNAKNELILPETLPIQTYRDEVLRRIFERYQQLLLINNALDFDDLLLWTVRLFEENLEVRDKYARRYEHVLVDEFQDTNLAQYTLLRQLSSFHRNIFAVGDTDQSIYRWRGADYRNVLRFQKDFPDTQVILLEQNYRSTQSILDVAMSVINRNPDRTPKRLFTERGAGHKIILYEAYDDRVEASFVIDTITRLVAQRQAGWGDFAVMYRTNAQSRVLEEAFLHAGIPYKLVGAQRFYGRKEIKDIIAYLRMIHNPRDELSLTRIINVPPRAIGDKTYLALRVQAQKEGLSPGIMLLKLAENQEVTAERGVLGRIWLPLIKFGTLLKQWVDVKEVLSPIELMDRVLADVDYRTYIDDGTDEGRDRWENIMELRRLASEFHEQGLEAFLEQIALVSDQDTMEATSGAPVLLTLHAAKGLEFPAVFVVGLNDGLLPHSRSFDDPEAMMEERRLFYVGITRARDRLFLTYAQNRSAFGYTEPMEPSRYLEDIPYDLLEEVQPSRTPRQGASRVPYRVERWHATGVAISQRGHQQHYAPGMRVLHSVWGEGLVLSSRLQEDDEIVDVYFAGVGLKRLLASVAGLQIKE